MGEPFETLFQKEVPVRLRHPDREDRTANLTVSVSVGLALNGANRQQALRVQLTDEADHMMLYTMEVNEEDFQTLKTEQCIVVDFTTFPVKFIELLDNCITATENCGDGPAAFSASLNTTASGTHLELVETNQFKHLTHLSLLFVHGNNVAVMRYLAARLKASKEDVAGLRDALAEETARREDEEQAAAARVASLEAEVRAVTHTLNDLQVRQSTDLAAAKEEATLAQRKLAQAMDAEKRDAVSEVSAKEAEANRALEKLRGENSDLRDSCTRLEAKCREQALKLESLEEQTVAQAKDLSSLRSDNKALDADKFENERKMHADAVRLSTLQQQVLDKDELVGKLQSLVESANAQKAGVEESLSVFKGQAAKLEKRCKVFGGEITKGNQIIVTLQTELKTIRGKLKAKKAALATAEQRLEERDHTVERSAQEASDARAETGKLRREIESLQTKLEEAKARIDEDNTIMERDKQMILFMNQQMNEVSLSHNTYYPSSGASGYKPPLGSAAALAQSNLSGSVHPPRSTSGGGANLSTSHLSMRYPLAASPSVGGRSSELPSPSVVSSSVKGSPSIRHSANVKQTAPPSANKAVGAEAEALKLSSLVY